MLADFLNRSHLCLSVLHLSSLRVRMFLYLLPSTLLITQRSIF